MEQRHRRLVAASCCIWLFTVVALVSCQNAPDVAGLRGLATEGDGAAQFDIGDRCFNGEGVPQDNGEAVRWYRLAADQGHARAQARLGFMYFSTAKAFRRTTVKPPAGTASPPTRATPPRSPTSG